MDTSIYLRFALDLMGFSRSILQKYFYNHYSKDSYYSVKIKEDGSPVTQADYEVENFFWDKIKERFPDHDILGEEFGKKDAGKNHTKEAEYLWVIDPLDGTKSFISGNPLFGTLLCLLYKGSPILGVMDLPVLGQCYWGEKGKDSHIKNNFGTYPLKTRSCGEFSRSIVRTSSIDMFTGAEDLNRFAIIQEEAGLVLYGGDCFCYAQLSAGFVDLVIEGDLKVYDFLALVPIIEGAGGTITDWSGQGLDLYSQTGKVIAAGNQNIHKIAMQHLN